MTTIGRPREFDRDAALKAAMLVFWRKGFLATSMNDLCDAMGIRSPSLYAAFGSKEDLYRAAMENYVETIVPLVWGPLADGPTARAGVEGFLLAAVKLLPECGAVPGGCMATLAALGEDMPGTIPDIVRSGRVQCLEMLRTRLNGAVATGELPASTGVERWSRFYLGVYQGMAVQARDGATSADLKGIAETAMDAWPGQGR
ncbi:TetR/AcrR family transcriptional regulator [Lichenifustis flavocetrariae]|uniref:TetR/AcrR family transcriptional regulator n=1 Tax=Lichenifustis flavocetrariae TaxID=2949735 RepID=A0AA41Z1K5_9HYPH|nr:TetR/AcrR family transcriptional regulator [Lichenifustis flavocetrariae]MCW6511158.1 TetR/AcrR family transcriptional regulator [Lichenifustis flavocetrariae]